MHFLIVLIGNITWINFQSNLDRYAGPHEASYISVQEDIYTRFFKPRCIAHITLGCTMYTCEGMGLSIIIIPANPLKTQNILSVNMM